MSFHLCPMEPRVARLFQSVPEKLLSPKMPIAERARQVAQRPFVPKANHIDYDKKTPLKTLLACHVARLFEGCNISLVDESTDPGKIQISLTVRSPNQQPRRLSPYAVFKPFLLRLECSLRPGENQLYLGWVKATQPGYAGNALASLYNFAADLGLDSINFIVRPGDRNANRFYYHIDFGRPIYKNTWQFWEVQIPARNESIS